MDIEKNNEINQAYMQSLNGEGDVQPAPLAAAAEGDQPVEQLVTFKTSDQGLIDALNKGFEEVVFFVKSQNEDGELSVEEVKVTGDSFADVQVTACEDGLCDLTPAADPAEVDLEGKCPECGQDPCVCECGGAPTEECGKITGECDKSVNTFESVLTKIRNKYLI